MRLAALALLALGTACTQGGTTEINNTAPVVSLTQPVDGARLTAFAPTTLVARVSDPDQSTDSLELDWSIDGSQAISEQQVSLDLPDGLPAGEVTLTLTATDAEGASSSDSVTVTVLDNIAPTVSFLSPASGTVLAEEPLQVDVRVTDPDETDLTRVTLTWGGLASGSGAPQQPLDDGRASVQLLDLPVGDGEIEVVATDSQGAQARSVVALTVIASDADNDGSAAVAWGGQDCDDSDPSVYPGAPEVCDGVDQDCDGTIDDGASDPKTWHQDADGDGYGDPATSTIACTPPAGWVAEGTDCNDATDTTYPGAPELCDGIDNDCSGTADDGDKPTWYRDADGDGSGSNTVSVQACSAPAGHVGSSGDCSDSDPFTYPGAPERCDSIDNDCDGSLPVDERTDADGDGWPMCDDCRDDVATINPGAAEVCDAVDQDCSGAADDGDVCPCEVEWFQGQPYQFCTIPRTWWVARSECEASGYDLVSLNTATEDAFIYTAINQRDFAYWWAGLERTSSGFAWVDGTDLSSYSNWGPSEPNDLYGNEDCGELNRFTLDDPTDDGWNDQKCDSEWAFVCEG